MRSLLVLTTRGGEAVPDYMRFMGPPIEVVTWDYTGKTHTNSFNISRESPGGGTTLGWIFEWALKQGGNWDYIGAIAHDIHGITPGGVQMMLDSARALNLACFAPAQEHTMPGLPHMRAVWGSYLRTVDWVESRSAWYHRDIIKHVIPYCDLSQSGHGIDCYAVPAAVRKCCPDRKIGIFDTVITYHCDEPGRSMNRLYRGLNVEEEKLLVAAQVARDERTVVE